jgi:hypothetical protein
MKTWKSWTQKEYVLLISLIQQGLKPKEIAAEMQGRSKSAVVGKIYSDSQLLSAYQQNRENRNRPKINYPSPVETAVEPTAITPDTADKKTVTVNISDAASVFSAICSLATLVLLSVIVALG